MIGVAATGVGPSLSVRQSSWLADAGDSVARHGFAIVEDVLDREMLARTREGMYAVQRRISSEVGADRLTQAGELGVLRLMLKYDSHFLSLLELDPVLAIVDHLLSPTAVLHLQNGLVLPPSEPESTGERFQTSFHRDFPRHMGGYLASINTFLAIDEFTGENGATLLVPASHQQSDPPTPQAMAAQAVPARCPAGSMIVFDSTLWHAAGKNTTSRDRLAINQQFTRSFLKQQIDYVRALGDECVLAQSPRTQQLLGWYTRIPASLADYYRPAEQRLYRAGQG